MGEFTEMISIKPVLPNCKHTAPDVIETVIGKNQPPYKELNVARVNYSDASISMISRYRFNWKERFKLFFKGQIWLEQLTFGEPLQPQRLTVSEPLTANDK